MFFRRLTAVIVFIVLMVQMAVMQAQTQPLESTQPFEMDAVSVLLLDVNTGTVILEKNADEQRPVASITKLMTMLLVMESIEAGKIDLNQEVTVSKEAAGMGGSQALLDAGGIYPVSELLKSLIVASANDSAVALAELIAGSEAAFAETMNARAKELGLHATHYVNASGLPAENQYTTARDVAQLSMEVLKHPVYFEYSKIWMDEIHHQKGRVTELVNTNRLIRFYEGADGVKTGSTNEAGYCISATAKRGEDRFLAVVLGCSTGKTRFALAQKLLDHAFDHYTVYKAIRAGDPAETSVTVKGSRTESIVPCAESDLMYLSTKNTECKAEIKYEVPHSLHAPVKKGERIGTAQLILDGEIVDTVPLVSQENAEKIGLFGTISVVLSEWMKG